MTEYKDGYKFIKFPKSRQIVADLLHETDYRYHSFGLVSFDITKAQKYFKEYKKIKGKSLSFSAWIIHCIGEAVKHHPYINAAAKGRKKVCLFEDVDVNIIIERKRDEGIRAPTKYVVRKANEKSLLEIHKEIRSVQHQDEDKTVLGKDKAAKGGNIIVSLPTFLRRIVFWILRRYPRIRHKFLGNLNVTSVGLFGKKRWGGHGITPSSDTVQFLIGGISKKPWVVDNKIQIREILDITLAFDHMLIDGAPAARFAVTLGELLESAYGLKKVINSIVQEQDKK